MSERKLDNGKAKESRVEKKQTDHKKEQSKTDIVKKDTSKKLNDNFKKK